MKEDIRTPEDIGQLVNDFYTEVMKSESLRSYFSTLDWDKHLPKMKKFWRFILLDEAGYTENVTNKHLHMQLTKELFDEWLLLFRRTIDQHFEGPRAELAKTRASLIGFGIQSKMNLLED
ncbi:MAG: group III truncated hemoglobin [Flavobacteriales bacterium]